MKFIATIMIICFVSRYICHYQLLKSMFCTLALSLYIHAMIQQLSNVFCIINLQCCYNLEEELLAIIIVHVLRKLHEENEIG